MSADNNKRIQSIDSIEIYAYGTSKNLLYKNDEIKYNSIKKTLQKMTNFDGVMGENIKDHNPNWMQTNNYQYKILIIRGSRFGKTNALFNLINHEPHSHKMY